MDSKSLEDLLRKVKNNKIDINDALEKLENLPFSDLGFAKIDNHREIRVGYPEIIYGEGKTLNQLKEIIKLMNDKNDNVLVTRCEANKANNLLEIFPNASYNDLGKTLSIYNKNIEVTDSFIAIVCAGTSDLPVVEEAYETSKILGNKVIKITDVGVAGIHRLFNKIELIREAKVVIVVAGMEGALASVIAGLVNKPIIAVPTSVGYGSNLGGITTLLSMLNSCASGVSVVNIDNGFGAAYNASMINKL